RGILGVFTVAVRVDARKSDSHSRSHVCIDARPRYDSVDDLRPITATSMVAPEDRGDKKGSNHTAIAMECAYLSPRFEFSAQASKRRQGAALNSIAGSRLRCVSHCERQRSDSNQSAGETRRAGL